MTCGGLIGDEYVGLDGIPTNAQVDYESLAAVFGGAGLGAAIWYLISNYGWMIIFA